jgi:formate dehydrogenase major subunit
VQVTPSNGPTEWQEEYNQRSELSRRIATESAMEPAE